MDIWCVVIWVFKCFENTTKLLTGLVGTELSQSAVQRWVNPTILFMISESILGFLPLCLPDLPARRQGAMMKWAIKNGFRRVKLVSSHMENRKHGRSGRPPYLTWFTPADLCLLCKMTLAFPVSVVLSCLSRSPSLSLNGVQGRKSKGRNPLWRRSPHRFVGKQKPNLTWSSSQDLEGPVRLQAGAISLLGSLLLGRPC